MSHGQGQKVTTTQESVSNPKIENPGTVLSDSLAAESITSGGSFAADSDVRGPSSQPAKSTTTNTTDTSNATRLAPAPDADARQAQEGWDDHQNQLNAAGRLGDRTQESGGNTYTTSGGTRGGSSGDDAQGSAAPSLGDSVKPKGRNLTEGGIDPSAPNASFTTEIGGENDPGRNALRTIEEGNVASAGGAGPRERKITNDGGFDVLEETSA